MINRSLLHKNRVIIYATKDNADILPDPRQLGIFFDGKPPGDPYILPAIIYPLTYLFSAIGGIIFIRLAHHVALKGIKDLDLVATMKNSD